jgi:hypothetical protein
MLQSIQSPITSGRFAPALALVLTSVVLLGTAVRGDSPSDSQGATTGIPGARSPRSTLNTANNNDPGALVGSGSTFVGGIAGSSESLGTPALPEAPPLTLTTPDGELEPFTDMLVVSGPDVAPTTRDEQADTLSPGTTFTLAGLLRLVAFGIIGSLVMWRLQRRRTH